MHGIRHITGKIPFKGFFFRTVHRVGLKSSLCNLPCEALQDHVSSVTIRPPITDISGGTDRQTHMHTEYVHYSIRFLYTLLLELVQFVHDITRHCISRLTFLYFPYHLFFSRLPSSQHSSFQSISPSSCYISNLYTTSLLCSQRALSYHSLM